MTNDEILPRPKGAGFMTKERAMSNAHIAIFRQLMGLVYGATFLFSVS